jgi:hypothetical protein
MSLNKTDTASLLRKDANTSRRADIFFLSGAVSAATAFFARVIIFSTNIRVSFAFATVVLILLWTIKAVHSAASVALR